MTGRGTTYLAYTFVNIKESVNDYQCLVYNSVYFMNKYGLEVWDDLLNALKDEKPNAHKLIRL